MHWCDRLRRLNAPSYRLPAPASRLVDCERCGSGFVNPVAQQRRREASWWIRLRCGECGVIEEVEASNEEATRFDRDLDLGLAKIAATVARIERDGMIANAEALTAPRRGRA